MISVDEVVQARATVEAELEYIAKLERWLRPIGISIGETRYDREHNRAIDCMACCNDCSFALCIPGHPMCGHICYDNCCGYYCWDNCC